MTNDATMYQDIERILVSREQISEAVKKMGAQITADYAGKQPIVVGILKGAVVFYADLIRELDLPMSCEFMSVSSYGAATKTTGVVQINLDLRQNVEGRDVIIVEDIVDSGVTLHYLKQHLSDRGAASIRICTLMDKPARRRVDLQADYCCFTIPDEFVVGYGLDYAEKYRNLPDICILSPKVYNHD